MFQAHTNLFKILLTTVFSLTLFLVTISFTQAQDADDRRFVPVTYTAATLDAGPDQPELTRIGQIAGVEAALEGRSGAFEITRPGASFVKVHFAHMQLAEGDTVTVANPAGSEVYTYPGAAFTTDRNPGFWAMSISGDRAIVRLHSANGGSRVVVDGFTHGLNVNFDTQSRPFGDFSELQSTCGANERVDVACYRESHPEHFANTAPVALLIVESGQWVCTGWRVGPNNHMLTNQHCIEEQAQLPTTEIWFNYQREQSMCSAIGHSNDSLPTTNVTKVTGQTLIDSDFTLDYSLFSLMPESFAQVAPFGYLRLDPRDPEPGEAIYIPQHGGGEPKQFGINSDQDAGGVCRINDIVMNGRTDKVAYFCDTTGGSSGSPVISAQTHGVIALHNWGTGVFDDNTCRASGFANSGIKISELWPRLQGYLQAPAPTGLRTSLNGSGEMRLQWAQPAMATWYHVYVYDGNRAAHDDWYDNNVICADGVCSLDVALVSGQYQWWVQSWNDIGPEGQWSGENQFTMVAGLTVPPQVNITGPAATVTETLQPTYEWAASSAAWYHIWVGTTAGETALQTWVAAEEMCAGGVCQYTPEITLKNNTAYEIWMQSWNMAGLGPWNSVGMQGQFQTALVPPAAIDRLAPLQGSTVGRGYPAFQWTPDENADWYHLWIGVTEPTASTHIDVWVSAEDANCDSGTCQYSPEAGLPAGIYNWYMESWGWGGFGPWNDTDYTFTITG